MSIRVIDVYDSFNPTRLLDVKFEYSEVPEHIRSFRSSYASIYELLERAVFRDTKREVKNIKIYKGMHTQ